MPRTIARNRIPRVNIGNRPITYRPDETPAAAVVPFQAYVTNFPALGNPGSQTFTAPAAGWYKFVQWGPGNIAGGGVNSAGGCGGYAETTVFLNAGQTVTMTIGRGSTLEDTVVTLPGPRVVTARAGTVGNSAGPTGGLGGTATGGDYNLTGANGGATIAGGGLVGTGTGGGTGGAPGAGSGSGGSGRLPFRGGNGDRSSTGSSMGGTPGSSGMGGGNHGCDGLVLIMRVLVPDFT